MAALLIGGSAMAAPVSVSDAKQKALSFVRQQAAKVNNPRKAKAMQNAQLTEANAFGNELHIFNVGGNNGFVIVSGDDRTEEILGYVDCGNFDINTIPANMKAWLQGYVNQIKSLGGKNIQKAPKKAAKPTIEKLMTTKWDQSGSYRCMLLDDVDEEGEPVNLSYYKERILTGCVATAMAQVLYNEAKNYKKKYSVWPNIQTNEIPAYSPGDGSLTGHTLPALPPIEFDWANMVDNYSTIKYTPTEEEEIAVGRLMQYCGRSVKMEYSDVSGAKVIDVPPAMSSYFNMNPYVQSVDRAYYNSQDWEDLLYNEFAHGRAVVYGATVGTSYQSDGHCFVLDGYKDGLFHVNWGWGLAEAINNTEYDGYFSLSVMRPAGAGSGASSAADAEYKYNQQAVINISYEAPAEIEPSLNFYWKSKSSVNTSDIDEFAWGTYNVFGAKLNFDGGWAIRNSDGTLEFLYQDYNNKEFSSIQVAGGVKISMSDLGIASKADGDYDLVHVSRISGTDTWYADKGTDKNYITATVSGGAVSKVVVHPVDAQNSQFSVKSIEFEGTMEANKENKVIVTIENTGDDYFGKLSMAYGTGTTAQGTQSKLATLKPGETTHEFTVKLAKGEYNLWFMFGDNSSRYAFGTGKMYIGYGADANKIQAGNLKFDGQTGSQLEVKSVNGVLANEVTGSFDITNSSGHIYNNTYYVAVEYGSGNSKKTYALAELPVSVEEGTHSIPFNLGAVSGLESGKTYKVRLYSKNGDEEVDVTTKDMTLQPYFRYWLADGTIKEAKEGYYDRVNWEAVYAPSGEAKEKAVAIDLRGISTTYMQEATNPNCVYFMYASQKPSSSTADFGKTNNVIDGAAEKMTINGEYDFYTPEEFTAEEITYTRKFANGNNNDGKGWETIILPFKVNSVKNGNKNLQWFKSSTDKRKHFWVMEFTDAKDNDLVFDYAQNFEANTPYLISVPGNKWGDNWDLTNKDITFRGVNVTVPASVLEPITYSGKSFVGMLAATTVNGWILNDEGTNFEQKEAEVKGFNAYITTEAAAPTMRIIIADATGIINVETEDAPEASSAIYNLNGMRVNKAQKGVYIQNGKKYVVK